MILALAFACSGPTPVLAPPPSLPVATPSVETADTAGPGVDTDPADTDLRPDTDVFAGLHGVVPANPLPIPSFAVTNFDGTSRGPEALLGHVTVMWFLPAANTGG